MIFKFLLPLFATARITSRYNQVRNDVKKLTSFLKRNGAFEFEHGRCFHVHGIRKHPVPQYKCTLIYSYESKEGHTCESLPHDDYGCPLEPQDYDNCGTEKCALGQPVGGESWLGRTSCDCSTRRMSIKDVEFYNEIGPTVTGVSGSALGKVFKSKQEFCFAQYYKKISSDSTFEPNM